MCANAVFFYFDASCHVSTEKKLLNPTMRYVAARTMFPPSLACEGYGPPVLGVDAELRGACLNLNGSQKCNRPTDWAASSAVALVIQFSILFTRFMVRVSAPLALQPCIQSCACCF